jgi:hypothetical protein
LIKYMILIVRWFVRGTHINTSSSIAKEMSLSLLQSNRMQKCRICPESSA